VSYLSRNAQLSRISLEKKEALGYGDGEFLAENSITKREDPQRIGSAYSAHSLLKELNL
jgi:hypothetical protein